MRRRNGVFRALSIFFLYIMQSAKKNVSHSKVSFFFLEKPLFFSKGENLKTKRFERQSFFSKVGRRGALERNGGRRLEWSGRAPRRPTFENKTFAFQNFFFKFSPLEKNTSFSKRKKKANLWSTRLFFSTLHYIQKKRLKVQLRRHFFFKSNANKNTFKCSRPRS